LTEAIKRFGHKDAHYIGGLENAAETLRDHVNEGDLVITLGAGSVYRVGDKLVELLRDKASSQAV
jgi:UDP-N-acetylmuramate--alanine ligase